MSCIYKIKEVMPTLTATEKKIAEYILEHPEEVTHQSTQELAQRSDVSTAAWVRFSQHLGYKGLPALKLDLARNTVLPQKDELFEAVVNENDTPLSLIEKTKQHFLGSIEQTARLLNEKSLEQAIELIGNAKNIYLMGVGASGQVCLDFMHKLTRINRNAVYYEDMHMLVARMAHMSEGDVLLAISYSGTTQIVNQVCEQAKEAGVPVIAITQFNPRTPLAKLADICLYIPVQEGELRLGAIASRNASLYITDLLYLGIIKENIDDAQEKLVKSRALINQIK